MSIDPVPPAVQGENAEAIRAWDGPLFERFMRFRDIVTDGFADFGEEALRLVPPRPGDRVLDLGCGLGDTTRRIAGLVGREGSVVGVDVAPSFVEVARTEAAGAGIANADFLLADVQTDRLGGPYDMVFSRFGTMFFASPVAAMRNVRRSLASGGRLVMVVWRRRTDNDWVYRAQTIVESMVPRPEQYDEPTCGPGPFSMAGADTTSDILMHAGYEDIVLHRCEQPIMIGADLEEAIDLMMALGPAGEILRLQGDRAADMHEPVRAALREGMADFVTDGGVVAGASTWAVRATA